MKILTLLMLLLLAACDEPTKVTSSSLTTALNKCGANEGIKNLYGRESCFTVFCNNGTHYTNCEEINTHRSRNVITAEELSSCSETCESNEGLTDLLMDNFCSKDTGGRFVTCLEFTTVNTCRCKNGISKTQKKAYPVK